MKKYFNIWKNFNNFYSTATRNEFSYFALIHGAIICLLILLGYGVEHPFASKVIGTLGGLFIVSSILPCAALIVRRLNALGKDRRLVFTALVPVVGLLYLIVLCMKSDGAKESERFLIPG
ncbi:DUF805 domain-containing protein [Maridesulfovibrio sp.]|uniref:DUF805 domain-containing protein n=1 Tax=Maridesulfovibrio sp. TaxID=2795000 RepID=UPI002A18CD49|nr:DUF805 domain-containing protein [Maridesulfovibrio sp.]